MRTLLTVIVLTTMVTTGWAEPTRRLSLDQYVDRMQAGWIGQMVGVGWGFPTEFKFNGRIIPADQMPKWEPATVNQFQQDDLYVEMTFLATLEQHGLDCSTRQAGIDLANSRYELWHANKFGRQNLRRGIAPPASGHPRFTQHSDDIDYQIESDYSGLIAPGMPQVAIELGEKFGRLMNYGDGVYGGQFVAGMYCEAFFEQDIHRIIEAGLACIPAESQYAEMVRDIVAWHQQYPDDWQATWRRVEAKYHNHPDYTHGLCCGPGGVDHFSIDVKLNGAYILIGLLYGDRDPDQTVIIATRCGQDSDCNPSNAAGILFTTIGYQKLPERFVSALDRQTKFAHTKYNFPKLCEVCEALALQAVERSDGHVEVTDDGSRVLVIPRRPPTPSQLMASSAAGPMEEMQFTPEEMAQIEVTE
ncbi:ADP-ribosylglycohydrolase family protein [Aeoliella sp. ICT_H6.2]|uniref:ADP-ribosylglycohydrolase family protein n=1 Tax=Aeoliella straminimaris TaxID=2954799 RepID=A0A9X2F8D7_9BACT|nr:ADP-ribosylglycohydrolase family protein [Aeoliella straminimaris]MCO6043734.1 ADP-ribosylglycohydrolase family protein [Aeoliella straminimaris]